ncbi:MAG: hypothetical protein JRN09_03675 [Nitrososphaerota archaeon]|nr:hypothetical protein [Nitrososphaerota archaeon]
MSPANYEALVARLASVCPAGRLAASLEGRFSSLLDSAKIYLPPRVYSRFSLSLLFYPVAGELLALLLPVPQAVLILASLALVQSVPFLVPLMLSHSRQRAVDAELPFFLIFLSIFSRETTVSIDDGLRKVAALGRSVFPAFGVESAIMERDLAFVPGAPSEVVEKTFGSHPSAKLRQFVHSLMVTLTTGKNVADFVDEESLRQVELMEARWKGFSESVGSLAEVSLMVLALFPVGLDMVAAAIPGLAVVEILLASLGLLGVFCVVLLVLMDGAQPILYNSAPATYPLVLSVAAWAASILLYYLGLVTIEVSLLLPLVVSALGALRTRGVYSRIRKGEEEVSALLHDLAEESKAGVSLPEALAKVSSGAGGFNSVRTPLAAFQRSIMLGSSPEEAQQRISHPSWLVRLSFGMLSVAFVTGAGYEKLQRLSSFFKRLSDARRNASRSLLPFFLVGVIVPGISIASMSFLSTFNQGGIPFLPEFGAVSRSYILISISAVSLMTGLLLSKLYAQTARHALAVPILLASTLVSLLVLGSL